MASEAQRFDEIDWEGDVNQHFDASEWGEEDDEQPRPGGQQLALAQAQTQ